MALSAAVAVLAEGGREGKPTCPNPACGATVSADRARCPRCGQALAETSHAQRLEPMQRALAEHRARIARVAREGEAAVAAARQLIESQRQRSRRELDQQLANVVEESTRSARAEFDRALARVGELAAEERGPKVGNLALRAPGGERQKLEVPVMLPLLDRGHVVIHAPEERRQDALGAVAGVLLDALASKPPGEVRYRIFDPIGTGSSLSAFGEFDRERVAHGLPISDADGLRSAVAELSRHATTVSSTFLRGQYSCLGEFIAEAGPGFVPYELLVLLDLPRAIDPELAERLTQLASHAASRGISFIAHVAGGAEPGVAFGPAAAELRCDDRGRWSCSPVPEATIAPAPPPSSADVRRVAERPLPAPPVIEFSSLRDGRERFTKSSAEGLAVAVGTSGLDPVAVRLDEDTVHGLIAGDTGSGKSNLLRVLIYGLAHDYSPDELQLYLLDFKESVEFREFVSTATDPTYLPHARVVSVNSSRAFGVAVLEHLAEETSRRYAELGGARKLSALREQRPEAPFPRLLTVIDEFQVLFNQGDLLADRAAAALSQVASQGRAAGVHLLLSTQSISDVAAGTNAGARIEPVYKNSRLRIGLRLGEAESRTLLRMSNPAAAEIHERGKGIVNHEDGDEEGNVLTTFALIRDEQARRERREAVSRAAGRGRPPRVFDGGRGAAAPANFDPPPGAAAGTWIGVPLALDGEDPRRQPSLFVPLPPDPNRHLATIGAGARSAAAVLQWSAVGFARRCAGSGRLLLVDLLREDDALPEGLVEATAAVAREAGADAAVVADREAETLLPRLEQFLLAAGDAPRAAVVFGFDRIRNFGAGESEFDPSSPRQALDRVLAGAGTQHGHLLAWWSTYDAFAQQVGMRDASFGLRVYLGMSQQQLQLIAPGEMDTAPADHTAYWHDYGAGSSPRLFHLYEPFGRGEEPGRRR
ncbi:MAG TPA: FtsK/SpoIIIE domain-containing protein [Solirubrobacterales bacterium]|nr:FtsK/SpoIIIE domain-containing protein [Solirubrobacterales bacterium]